MRRFARLARELMLIRRAFRNWRTVAAAGLLWRHLPLPRRELTLVTRRGTRIVVPLGKAAGALYPPLEIFAFSEYAFDWELEEEPLLVDIGAHVGSFTLWVAERYPRCRAVCFEPDPDAFSYLVRNVGGVATLTERAVGAHGATATLHRPIAAGAISSLHGTSPGDAVAADVVALEDVLGTLGDVSLLKLDCEGCEYDLILDTPPEAWARVRRVVLEYHPVDGHDSSVLVERLGAVGLRLVRAEAHNGVGTCWFSR